MSQQTYTVELTKDEIEVLRSIAYFTVGGDPKGPRRHVQSLISKIRPFADANAGRYYRAFVEIPEHLGNPRVVIEELT